MSTKFHVTGSNEKAPFTLKVHRGDGMALLAMNWREGKPPHNFVGFAIEFREPQKTEFWPVRNRIGFPGQRQMFSDPYIPSTMAPLQYFRWVHFPNNPNIQGQFTYLVTPMFMDETGALSRGEPQTATLALMRETHPGQINIAFTRGFVSSQAFVKSFEADGAITTLVPGNAKNGLEFKPTHTRAEEAYEWMGFEARSVILELLDEAIQKQAEVRMIAYDLNLPEIVTRLEKLGSRLKIIIDDSKEHKQPSAPESKAAVRLRKSAGNQNVVRQHMSNLQHHKSIAVRGAGIHKVVFGSTNYTWRGFYVQSNNAAVVTSKNAVDDYFKAFDDYCIATTKGKPFKASKFSARWYDLGIPGLTAKVGYSPHKKENGLLEAVANDISKAKSCVLFSLAFLGQMKKGPIGPALGKKIKSKDVFTLGIADARVNDVNLGVKVITPENKRRVVHSSALTGNAPKPFANEPSGLAGEKGNKRGTRMHHKFVVIDFDRPDARVYFGSYNFSEPADQDNGENLVLIKDRTIATSYMIEAIRLYDHYRYRTVHQNSKGQKQEELTLRLPPRKSHEKPWWQKYWDDPIRKQDRLLFS